MRLCEIPSSFACGFCFDWYTHTHTKKKVWRKKSALAADLLGVDNSRPGFGRTSPAAVPSPSRRRRVLRPPALVASFCSSLFCFQTVSTGVGGCLIRLVSIVCSDWGLFGCRRVFFLTTLSTELLPGFSWGSFPCSDWSPVKSTGRQWVWSFFSFVIERPW